MIIGTSAMPHTELDCIINQYSGQYNNPFLAWGRYHKNWLKTKLPISFQFHHAQMDGAQAGKFLANIQEEINRNLYESEFSNHSD
jgi:chloramphenicol O-acetyltransferase type A